MPPSFRRLAVYCYLASLSLLSIAIADAPPPVKTRQDPWAQDEIGNALARLNESQPAGPTFRPSNSPTGITCSYPDLQDYVACNSEEDRSCWLKSKFDRPSWDINTDYEAAWPRGITREYYLEISEQALSPDGYVKSLGLLVNGTYPGPVIEACWGDELVIHVTNRLTQNGTTLHMHGIRQLNTTAMDGVNAVSQCPIAGNETFTYRWRATQYGHSWYHSHYSLQYADGLAGPILLHGPSSADWDVAWDQMLISDWVHRSAFEDFQVTLDLGIPAAQSIVVNGTGHYKCSATLLNSSEPDARCCSAAIEPSPECCAGDSEDPRCQNFGAYFQGVFTKAMFIFSIDGHRLKVISADLVPILPYETDSIFIGIGQRYEVIVEGEPAYDAPDGNYWLRTRLADLCGLVEQDEETTGIIRYNASSSADPETTPNDNRTACRDEAAENLRPIVPWQIDPTPVNDVRLNDSVFQAGLSVPLPKNITHSFIRWSLDKVPIWLDFSHPTILGLENTTYRPEQAVVPYSYEHGFVYMIVTSQQIAAYANYTGFELGSQTAPHPMHLHGHDFAVLAQLNGEQFNFTTGLPPLNLHNPPRRDTVLLDSDGILVIAFKPDNPGIWMFHCHIAWHVSSGLGFQILERRESIVDSMVSFDKIEEGCESWRRWDLQYDQNDSGV